MSVSAFCKFLKTLDGGEEIFGMPGGLFEDASRYASVEAVTNHLVEINRKAEDGSVMKLATECMLNEIQLWDGGEEGQKAQGNAVGVVVDDGKTKIKKEKRKTGEKSRKSRRGVL